MAKVQRNKEETLTARHGDTVFIGPEGVEVIPNENSEEFYYEEQPRFEEEQYQEEPKQEYDNESNDQEIVAQPGDTIIIEADGNVRIER